MIDIGLRLLTSGRQRTLTETYILKAVKYLLLVDVTFLFCLGDLNSHLIVLNQVVMAGLVLLMYFVGKLQNSQNRVAIFKMMGRGIPQVPRPQFNRKAEVGVIVGAIAVFVLFWFYPWLATNGASRWFRESILSIEKAFFFGFIFKVIGFFFILSMLLKVISGFTFLLSGGKPQGPDNGIEDNFNEDDFDDYEEVE
ncbi:MAG: hypothetical protein CSA03_00355 [Bacteroidetes bacterium]|nr:MAG: hypothetical protein CSA03_00355 [Bacteroidota bacterium]